MNVTSLELSKQLFEVSGWQDMDGPDLAVANPGHPPTYARQYTLGYLLRKLPTGTTIKKEGEYDKWRAQLYPKYWYEDGTITEHAPILFHASSPENAACKLAIELFKQGVLKKENA